MFAGRAGMEPWVCPVSPEGAVAVDPYWADAFGSVALPARSAVASPDVGPAGIAPVPVSPPAVLPPAVSPPPVSGVAPIGAAGAVLARRRETLLFPRHAEPADPEDELAFDFF